MSLPSAIPRQYSKGLPILISRQQDRKPSNRQRPERRILGLVLAVQGRPVGRPHRVPGGQEKVRPGPNPMKTLQACIYKLVIASVS